MYDNQSTPIFINETDISNDYDREYLFIRNTNYTETQWIDVQNEHFIVWMQMESFPDFRKLWGRINSPLVPGTYKFIVNSASDVASFGGTKGLVLSTSARLGRSALLGYILIGAAGVCFLLLIIMILLSKIRGNPLNCYDELEWD